MVLQFMAFFAALAVVSAGIALVWPPFLWVGALAAVAFAASPVVFCAWLVCNVTES